MNKSWWKSKDDMSGKKVLITGGLGFLGYHLTKFLLDNTDWKLVLLDRLDETVSPDRFHKSNRIEFVWWDLKAALNEQVKLKLQNIDIVIHAAASSHVDRSIVDPISFVMDNVVGTCNLLEWAKNNNLERFLYIGTDEIFGSLPDFPFYERVFEHQGFFEDSAFFPHNPYASSKASAECMVTSYACTYKVPCQIIRMTNILGPYQHPEKFILLVINKLLKDEEVEIHSDKYGKQSGTRYYLDVRDACGAIYILLTKTEEVITKNFRDEGIFHISGNKAHSNLEVAKLIAKLMNKELKYVMVPYSKNRPYHDMHYKLNDIKIRTLTKWRPKIELEESLKDIISSLSN